MRTAQYRPMVSAPAPFVSVYFDDTHDTADAEERLETIWRRVDAELRRAQVPADTVAAVQRAVLSSPPAVGRRGRGIVAAGGQVFVNEHLAAPPQAMTVRVSEYPYLVPLVAHGVHHPMFVTAAVDHAGADVKLHRDGVVQATTVVGDGYPIHKAASARFGDFDDPQPRTEEAIRKNVRAIADHLTGLVDSTGVRVVFVTGEVRARNDVVAALPERIAERVIQLRAGARTGGVAETRIDDLVETEFERLRAASIDDTVQRFRDAADSGSGLAAEGIADVCASLRSGDVDTLIIADPGEATVVTGASRTTVAPDPDVLSELGEAPVGVARVDESLPLAAIAVGASLVAVGDALRPADGIAVLRRYRPSELIGQGESTSGSLR